MKMYFSLFWMNNQGAVRIQSDIPEISSCVYNLLSDDESKTVYKSIIQKRKNGVVDYTDIFDPIEYFRNDFFNPKNEKVYVDAGAFDGDSVKKFEKYNPGYSRIYAFEPDEDNYTELIENCNEEIRMNKVVPSQYGLSDNNDYALFEMGAGVSSAILQDWSDADSISKIKCIKLDDAVKEKVSMIKMDIEGNEIKALHGAENILKRDTPDLAICIYHKPDDLWNIPLLIHKMVPQYKMYIRHHGILYTDTVLYATVGIDK